MIFYFCFCLSSSIVVFVRWRPAYWSWCCCYYCFFFFNATKPETLLTALVCVCVCVYISFLVLFLKSTTTKITTPKYIHIYIYIGFYLCTCVYAMLHKNWPCCFCCCHTLLPLHALQKKSQNHVTKKNNTQTRWCIFKIGRTAFKRSKDINKHDGNRLFQLKVSRDSSSALFKFQTTFRPATDNAPSDPVEQWGYYSSRRSVFPQFSVTSRWYIFELCSYLVTPVSGESTFSFGGNFKKTVLLEVETKMEEEFRFEIN